MSLVTNSLPPLDLTFSCMLHVVVGWEHVRDANWQAQHLSQQNSNVKERFVSGFIFNELQVFIAKASFHLRSLKWPT